MGVSSRSNATTNFRSVNTTLAFDMVVRSYHAATMTLYASFATTPNPRARGRIQQLTRYSASLTKLKTVRIKSGER